MSCRSVGRSAPLEGLEAEAFKAYCWLHYQQALHDAQEHAVAWAQTDANYFAVLPVLLDKLASPLVYVRQAWDSLPADEKAKYSPELGQRIAEAGEEAKKAWEARRT